MNYYPYLRESLKDTGIESKYTSIIEFKNIQLSLIKSDAESDAIIRTKIDLFLENFNFRLLIENVGIVDTIIHEIKRVQSITGVMTNSLLKGTFNLTKFISIRIGNNNNIEAAGVGTPTK